MINSAITHIAGTGIPVRGNDIDTDRIVPARFLRAVTFEGLGKHVFEDDRKQSSGIHPFDDSRYAGASILLVNNNFGSGSSREHAPQALMRWGIKAIVGESFGEIFSGNSLILGIPCLVLREAEIVQLQNITTEDHNAEIAINLENRMLSVDEVSFSVRIPEPVRESFITGRWDALGELLHAPEATRKVHDRLPYINGFSD